MTPSTARVILGQVVRIATCGTSTYGKEHTGSIARAKLFVQGGPLFDNLVTIKIMDI